MSFYIRVFSRLDPIMYIMSAFVPHLLCSRQQGISFCPIISHYAKLPHINAICL